MVVALPNTLMVAFGRVAIADTGDSSSSSSIDDSGITNVTTEEWILAGVVFVSAIVISVAVRAAVHKAMVRAGAPIGVARLFARFSAMLMIIVGFFYAMSTIDVRVGPLLGALGVGGIALAFALQEILSNLVSGIMLQIRRPFEPGDQIDTNDLQGTVQKVDLRVVTLRTFDGEEVFVPNSMVLQNPIINWTRTPTRRTILNIGVAYGDDVDGAQRCIVESLRGVEGVETEPEPQAYVYEFGDSSVNFAVHIWHQASNRDMWTTRDNAARAMKKALDEAGYSIPFPQQTLWFGPGNTELAIRKVAESDAADDQTSVGDSDRDT